VSLASWVVNLTISFKSKYHIFMDADDKDKEGVKQPENMVYYKSREELYSTLHMCIVLRELPELTPEELRQISEREKILSER
jgi:hypothetical protein